MLRCNRGVGLSHSASKSFVQPHVGSASQVVIHALRNGAGDIYGPCPTAARHRPAFTWSVEPRSERSAAPICLIASLPPVIFCRSSSSPRAVSADTSPPLELKFRLNLASALFPLDEGTCDSCDLPEGL